MTLTFGGTVSAEETNRVGERIYVAKCIRCHGSQGKGTQEYPMPLAGDLSIAQLAELIQETMPEDNPGSLSMENAAAVAGYVHDAFYSPIARMRNQPPRIELARLTVGQYRQTVADLIAGFREPAKWDDRRGLTGEYYAGRRVGGRRGRALERIDSQIDFDFGTDAPVPEITNPKSFSIRWTGSVLVPETGEYEFIVRTEHAARFWINHPQRPLIDAWVKSGDDTQYSANLFLIGGRVYPVRLEFTKAFQGVNDAEQRNADVPSLPTSIALLWKRPHAVPETIPAQFLSPESAPEVFVCETPFPPDDRSYGWVRGTSVSSSWHEATTYAAIETARYVAAHLNDLAGTSDNDPQRAEKLRAFCREFIELAFRYPIRDEAAQRLIDQRFDSAKDAETAVKRTVLLALKSPRFLFREIGGPQQYKVASRLSFGLWDSLPDEELLQAVQDGRLKTKEDVVQQARRMLADQRAKTKLHAFLLTWLEAESGADLTKDTQRFPGFAAETAADLRTSLELFLDDVVGSDDSDYRRLLLDERVFVNERLAKFYGVEVDSGEQFTKLVLDDGKRAGVLTHPYVMAHFADAKESSPIHRGVFLVRHMLGRTLRPPPEAVTPLPPELHPSLTTRQRVELQTQAANCMMCHGTINPLGFTLEHFDAAGRYRELDRGQPVNASGAYLSSDGDSVQFKGARDLAGFLANSEQAHAAFAEQMFHHLVQQPVQAYGSTTLDELRRSFAKHDFNIRDLAVEVMAVSALVGREKDMTSNEPAD